MKRTRTHPTGSLSSALAACLALGVAALTQAGGVPAFAAAHDPSARAAQAQSVRDEGRLRLVKRSGSVLLEEGPASGTLSGKVRARFFYNGGPVVTAQFTIDTAGGTIRAHGLGRLSSPTSSTPSFAGPLAIAGGSGRYAHARGRGRLYGVLNLNGDNLILQPVGQLDY